MAIRLRSFDATEMLLWTAPLYFLVSSVTESVVLPPGGTRRSAGRAAVHPQDVAIRREHQVFRPRVLHQEIEHQLLILANRTEVVLGGLDFHPRALRDLSGERREGGEDPEGDGERACSHFPLLQFPALVRSQPGQ